MKDVIKFGKDMAMRPTNYTTRHREEILQYIQGLHGAHSTAKQLVEHFASQGKKIGLATVYRHLERLELEGKIRKYNFDAVAGACYQVLEADEEACLHFHMKCEKCGALHHLQCKKLDEIEEHVFQKHQFQINPSKTVFYGTCSNCADAEAIEETVGCTQKGTE